jgi:hypothetical protein
LRKTNNTTSQTNIMKNADIVRMYEKPTSTDRTCRLCEAVVKQPKAAGYKNLISHFER